MGNSRVFFRFAIPSAMRKLIPVGVVLLIVPFLLFAQSLTPRKETLLLLNAQHVSGVVTDSSGNPIVGAAIWHTYESTHLVVTDASGHFDLSTRAPAFVIRKDGYEGVFVRTEDASEIQITLKNSTVTLPACSEKSTCTSLDGFDSAFCFPHIDKMKVSDQSNDIDYGNRIYSIGSGKSRQTMQHAAGPMWGVGLPYDGDVWGSVEYSERTYRYGEGFIVDARGKTKDGKLWRFVGRFGESAAYQNVDQEAAAQFDRVLDGVCVRAAKQK